MGITKLMHMKESPKCAHAHLRNAINYILDVKNNGEKTEGGIWVGGNSGADHKEVLENFLETKRDYGKLNGRQGYHFVISFAPGETNIQTVYNVAKEFCKAYLGDDYDYVFAVHNDKPHLHAHVIFNSVDRIDGHKYHYKKGDWKKDIQPVTDRICKQFGLKELKVNEKRQGTSYAEWAAVKKGNLCGKNIIRADIDRAIEHSGTFEEFRDEMKRMGYKIRTGNSKKYGQYLSFKMPGGGRARRDYNLGDGYLAEDIKEKIRTKSGGRSYEEVSEKLLEKAAGFGFLKPTITQKSTRTFRRMYQAVSYYMLPNPYAVPQHQVRQDMLRINNLLEECRYLKENHITTKAELEKRQAELSGKQRLLEAERKTLYILRKQMAGLTEEQKELFSRYQKIKQEYEDAIERNEDRFEQLEDERMEMEENFPEGMLETEEKIGAYTLQLRLLRQEKRIVERILKTESEKEIHPEKKPTMKSI